MMAVYTLFSIVFFSLSILSFCLPYPENEYQIRAKRETNSSFNFTQMDELLDNTLNLHRRSNSISSIMRAIATIFNYDVIKRSGSDYGVMVYTLDQSFDSNLIDAAYFSTRFEANKSMAIWVFKCGYFNNNGIDRAEYWTYVHNCFTASNNDHDLKFYAADCPDPTYRKNTSC